MEQRSFKKGNAYSSASGGLTTPFLVALKALQSGFGPNEVGELLHQIERDIESLSDAPHLKDLLL